MLPKRNRLLASALGALVKLVCDGNATKEKTSIGSDEDLNHACLSNVDKKYSKYFSAEDVNGLNVGRKGVYGHLNSHQNLNFFLFLNC